MSPLDGALPTQPRARGAVEVAVRLRDGHSVISDLRQSGSARAMSPHRPGPAREVVLVNTAGGVTGGDRFDWCGRAEAGAWLCLSTQAAERGYRAQAGQTGRLSTTLCAEAGARIDWLPQETILFDGASLARKLEADLAPGATLLAIEPLVFGRQAMGERLNDLSFTDQWRIRREGRLIHAEAFRLTGDGEAALARAGVMNGARASAAGVYVGPDLEAMRERLRPVLPPTGAISLMEGVMTLRLIAADARALRLALAPILSTLRGGSAPKVWTI